MMEYKDLGEQISLLRRQQKISQQVLADQVGISRATLNALEGGRATDVGLRKVIKVLNYLGFELAIREKSAFPTFEELRGE